MKKLEEIIDYIEFYGTEIARISNEDSAIMSPQIFTKRRLAKLFDITPVRVWQLSKRKRNPLPLELVEENYSGQRVLIIEESKLAEWISREEKRGSHSQKKINLEAAKKELQKIGRKRKRIIRKYQKKLEE